MGFLPPSESTKVQDGASETNYILGILGWHHPTRAPFHGPPSRTVRPWHRLAGKHEPMEIPKRFRVANQEYRGQGGTFLRGEQRGKELTRTC